MVRRVTLRDVAKESGLSVATVSYALRGLQVPVETQDRVREVADRLGYQADPIARALASGRTDSVGLICGSLTDMWQQGLAADLGRALLATSRHALIVDAGGDPTLEATLARQLVDRRVDALIVLPVDPAAAHWTQVAQETVLVSIGDGIPSAATAAEVVFDNSLGVRDALHRLADIGHRRIAVLTPSQAKTPDRPAELIVRQVADGLDLDARLYTSPNDLAGAAQVAATLLDDPDGRPTAFFCLSDSMAYGVYAAAQQRSIEIPTELSVLGYDDNAVSQILHPALTTYSWPLQSLVATVVARVDSAIDDGTRGDRDVLPPTLQLRGSMAAPSR